MWAMAALFCFGVRIEPDVSLHFVRLQPGSLRKMSAFMRTFRAIRRFSLQMSAFTRTFFPPFVRLYAGKSFPASSKFRRLADSPLIPDT
ncbi:MAG: hypothetical protein ABSB50_08290 [Terracidiphilus sp.]|jgi:hypothetical protein